ncbi:MAG TPA: tRNA pseudouridine(38-40) synthase TruA [Acidimicrobiia bacterium]|jgi:tRNA pseudouridine38-40 synthase|nr:tRNA pseudouridine(38-40) synthase TruA [Acidimicrobiia bacterium]HIL46024.1 tRNA pseudouridine(38-40) synthase TruA [Acidimicrobiia bacterium]
MRVRGTVAYDGSSFHGFAINQDVRTVAGDLTANLSQILGQEITLTCAGRTDRGVHAVGQVISFDAPDDANLKKLRHSLNRLCQPSIALTELVEAPKDFDARFSANGRCYRYRILNRPDPDPFLANTAWHVSTPLRIDLMEKAAAHLVGLHNFSSFCKRTPPKPGYQERSLIRHVEEVSWRSLENNVVEFEIAASSFCHQMVRAVVGTLVDVGRGRTAERRIPEILAAQDRQFAGPLAPPHGLTLWSVRYPSFEVDEARVAEGEPPA